MAVVRMRSCLGCGRTLKRGKATRCGRCRAERQRAADVVRKRESRARQVPAQGRPQAAAESPFRDGEGRPISPALLPGLLHDPAHRPRVGTPEWRDLRAGLEAYAASLPEGDPLASDLLGLVEYDFPLPAEAATPPVGGAEFGTRHLEVSVSELNENDLIAWIQDSTFDAETHRALVAELARRESAGRFDPRNAGAICAALTREIL
jgi:hypothetical protein